MRLLLHFHDNRNMLECKYVIILIIYLCVYSSEGRKIRMCFIVQI